MSRTEPISHETRPSPTAGSVTVLMPVYNGERFLRAQIESILDQDFHAVRLTVLDDASVDGSLAIAKEFAAIDPRVTVLRNYMNQGLIRSVGRLMSSVVTEYFALADQDDVWDTSKLRRSVDVLRSRGALLVYSDVRVCDEHGTVTEKAYLRSRGIRPAIGREPVAFVFRNPAIGHTIVARREVAEVASDIPPDLVFHEAWIVAAACAIGQVDFINDQLGSYRVHSTNVVGPLSSGLFHRFLRMQNVPGRLQDRERTRANALTAISRWNPEMKKVAELYRRRGTRRIIAMPILTRFLVRHARQIGVRAVVIESILFVICGFARAEHAPVSNANRQHRRSPSAHDMRF
jgi:glycosyltransferase involved in cell wall biosynthesis